MRSRKKREVFQTDEKLRKYLIRIAIHIILVIGIWIGYHYQPTKHIISFLIVPVFLIGLYFLYQTIKELRDTEV